MGKEARLLERAGDLKVALGDFVMEPRFRKELEAFIGERLEEGGDEEQLNTLIDTFVLQVPLKGGMTVVERFAATQPGLSDEERDLLRSWTDPVQGVFEIVERTGDGGVVGLNLLNELTYVIRSNMGPVGLTMLDPGVVFVARIVPIREDWMITGPAVSYRSPRETALIRARLPQLMLDNRREVFRNPEKLAAGRAMQEEQRQAFLDLYGDDVLVVPGKDVADRMMAVYQRVQKNHGGIDQTPVPFPFPPECDDAESVALIFDAVDGLGFYVDYDRAQRAFAEPALIVEREYRQVISAYLREESGPVPILRLVRDADPQNVDQLFQRLLNKPGFRWERDGRQLLRRYKATWYADPPLPRTVPVVAATPPVPSRPKPGKTAESPLRILDDAARRTGIVGRLTMFVGWLGAGRKLTQKGHLTLGDARELVEILETDDVIDPEIGGRIWKTKSSEELAGLKRIVGIAKAVRLVRATGGRLVPVKKNAGLLDRPGELLGAIVSALPGLAKALLPNQWESLLGEEFDSVVPAVLGRLYRPAGPVAVDDLSEVAWITATERYWLQDIPAEQLDMLRMLGQRDFVVLVETLSELEIIERTGTEPSQVELSDLGRNVLARLHGASLPGEPVHHLADTGGPLTYEYDFGDGWIHSVEIEETLPADAEAVYPACVAGAGACPPEDCGGMSGYFRLREILADPGNPEHESYLEWLGLESTADFDPCAFDVKAADGRLP